MSGQPSRQTPASESKKSSEISVIETFLSNSDYDDGQRINKRQKLDDTTQGLSEAASSSSLPSLCTEVKRGFHLQASHLKLFSDVLKCPVCLTYLDRRIVQCVNGHCICQGCKKNMEKCPTCSGPFSNMKKNTIMEQILKITPHRCRYDECSKFIKPEEDHELFCRWRITPCRFACVWSGPVCYLSSHVENEHSPYHFLVVEGSRWFKQRLSFTCGKLIRFRSLILTSVFKHYLWQFMVVDPASGLTLTYCPLLFEKPLEHDIWLKISLTCKTRAIDIKIKINTETNIDFHKENCIKIPEFLEFVENDQLLYRCTVSKT